MAFIKNMKDWIGGALDVYKVETAEDIAPGLVRNIWQAENYELTQKGDVINSDFLNGIQNEGIHLIDVELNEELEYDILKTSNTSDLKNFGIKNELKLMFYSKKENNKKILLEIDDNLFEVKKIINGETKEIEKNDIEKGKYYNLIFYNNVFIITNLGTENNIIKSITGTEYKQSNIFGTNLKEIKKDESYIYIDLLGKRSIYIALQDAINPNGFIVPDSTNFEDFTTSSLLKKIKGELEFKTSGWYKMDNGLILQWFTHRMTTATEIGEIFTFPRSFSVACTLISSNDLGGGCYSIACHAINKTQGRIWSRETATGQFAPAQAQIFALGY